MKFAVIGDPISHSLSPVMHNTNFKVLGLNDTYEALHIPCLLYTSDAADE